MNGAHTSTEFGIGGAWLAEYTLRALDAGVLVCDGRGRIVQWNTAAARLVGLSEEQIAGRTFGQADWDVTRPDGARLCEDDSPVRRVLASGDVVEAEMVGVRRRGGARAWLALTALPVFGPDAAVRAALVSIVDVSSEINLQRTFVETMRWARSAFEQSLAAHVVFDRAGRVRDWNRSLVRLVERTDAELLDARLDDICDLDLDWIWRSLESRGGTGAVEGRTRIVRPGREELPVAGFMVLADWPLAGRVVSAQFLAPAAIGRGERLSP